MDFVLAIDVGFVHLGYCLYCKTSVEVPGAEGFKNEEKTIIKLGILNINECIKGYKFEPHTEENIKRIYVINNWFNELQKIYNIKLIVVEKQVRYNIKCMIIASCLMTLAINKNINFKSYDPKNKFKYENIKYDSAKKEHKKIAVRYATNILLNTKTDMKEFNQFSKKDDIADALCMALMSVENEDYIKKIIKTSVEA